MCISKELLSAVFGQEVTKIKAIETKWDMQVLPFWSLEESRIDGSLNEKHFYLALETIAHKCKEWAFKEGYTLLSEYSEPSSCGIYLKDDCDHEINGFIMKTEVEAIIEASQWVLDNRSSKGIKEEL